MNDDRKEWVKEVIKKIGLGNIPHAYVLEDGKPKLTNMLDAIATMDGHTNRIDFTKIMTTCSNQDVEVSTVFIGHFGTFRQNPLRLFETMVFGGKFDQHRRTWETMADAKAGHWNIVDALREGKDPEGYIQ